MAIDVNGAIQLQTIQTGSFNSSPASVPTNLRVYNARVLYSDFYAASGGTSTIFRIQRSDDNGSTWLTLAESDPITMPNTIGNKAAGEVYLPFTVAPSAAASARPLVRLTQTMAGSPTSPTITYSCYLATGRTS